MSLPFQVAEGLWLVYVRGLGERGERRRI